MMVSQEVVDRLQKALDYITAHPEDWDQGDWLHLVTPEGKELYALNEPAPAGCGSAGCLAGRIAIQSPDVQLRQWGAVETVMYKGEQLHVAAVATNLLNPDNDRSLYLLIDHLFDADNTLEELWALGQELCGGRLRIPTRIS